MIDTTANLTPHQSVACLSAEISMATEFTPEQTVFLETRQRELWVELDYRPHSFRDWAWFKFDMFKLDVQRNREYLSIFPNEKPTRAQIAFYVAWDFGLDCYWAWERASEDLRHNTGPVRFALAARTFWKAFGYCRAQRQHAEEHYKNHPEA